METKRYKEIIDNDLNTFPINKRFIQLERSWIKDLSHKLMPSGKNFYMHKDREEFRRELRNYLKLKIREKEKNERM